MICYKIENNLLIKSKRDTQTKYSNFILLSDINEFEACDFFRNIVKHKNGYSKYSKFEVHPAYVFSSLAIPDKINSVKFTRINIYIKDSNLIFVDNIDYVESVIETIINNSNSDMTTGRFLYCFFNTIIANDLIFAESIEQQLSDIEENIITGNFDKFHNNITPPKNKLANFYRYYNHLLDIAEGLDATDYLFKGKYEKQLICLLITRVKRLKSEISYLREYAMQIQGIYQSQIDTKQNDIMKVLTIVTTIVLPLSLIAGWYGMNFKYMPELLWKYGYLYAVILSIVIIVICLIVFKIKKYW